MDYYADICYQFIPTFQLQVNLLCTLNEVAYRC